LKAARKTGSFFYASIFKVSLLGDLEGGLVASCTLQLYYAPLHRL